MHGAALPLGIAAPAPRQLRHDALGIHAAGQHVPVVAVARDDLVGRGGRHLHAHHDGLLADVEVAEAADEAHAVHLAGLFLEAADQQHVGVGREFLLLGEGGEFVHLAGGGRSAFGFGAGELYGDSHGRSLRLTPALMRAPIDFRPVN